MSTVWKVFSGRKSPDFYVVPMMHGGALKVSLHTSGSWQVGLTKEYQEKAGITGSRHWEIWRRGSEIAPGITRSWYLLIPDQELRLGSVDSKAVQLPPVGRDGAVSLEVLRLSNDGPTAIFEHSKIVGRWPLHGTNESCLIVARRVPWHHESQQWANECRSHTITEATAAGVPPDASHRYFFHGHDAQAVRFGLELGSPEAT